MLNNLLLLRGKSTSSKESVITLLWKKANLVTLKNLRPISLMPTLAKILSKILADRLAQIIFKHNLIHWSQQGFLKGSRCEVLMAAMLDLIRLAKSEPHSLSILFYDLSAAFDVLHPSAVRLGLTSIGAPREVLGFFDSYLQGASTRIRFADGLSSPIDKTRGTPQGDPLSPYLFVIWISLHLKGLYDSEDYMGVQHDFKTQNASCSFKAFGLADDISHIAHGDEDLQKAHILFSQFCLYFGASINAAKCRLLYLNGAGHSSFDVPSGIIQQMAPGERCKWLGITLDHQGNLSSGTANSVLGHFIHTASLQTLSPRLLTKLWLTVSLPKIRWSARFFKDFSSFRHLRSKVLDILTRHVTHWYGGSRFIRHRAWEFLGNFIPSSDVAMQAARMALDLINTPSPFRLLFRSTGSLVRHALTRVADPETFGSKRSLHLNLNFAPVSINLEPTLDLPGPSSSRHSVVFLGYHRSSVGEESWAAFIMDKKVLDNQGVIDTSYIYNAIQKNSFNSTLWKCKVGLSASHQPCRLLTVLEAACQALVHDFCLNSFPTLVTSMDLSHIRTCMSSSELCWIQGQGQRVQSLWALGLALHSSKFQLHHVDSHPKYQNFANLADSLAVSATKRQLFPYRLFPVGMMWFSHYFDLSNTPLHFNAPPGWSLHYCAPIVSNVKHALRSELLSLSWANWNYCTPSRQRSCPLYSSCPDLSAFVKPPPFLLDYLVRVKWGNPSIDTPHQHDFFFKEVLDICTGNYFASADHEAKGSRRRRRPVIAPRCVCSVDPSTPVIPSIHHSKICSVLSPPQVSELLIRDLLSCLPPDSDASYVKHFWLSHTFPYFSPKDRSSLGINLKFSKSLRVRWDVIFMKEYSRFRNAVLRLHSTS